MDPLLFALIVFSAQLFIIVGVAAVAEAVGRVTHPRLCLAYWRGIAFACLMLPLSAIAGLGPGPESAGSGVTFLVASVEGVRSATVRTVLPAAGADTVVWVLLCAGVVTRLGWLCVGAVRLRQLRRRSRPAGARVTPDLEAIRADVAPRAGFRISSEVAQPVSFGLRHPIVLLPERFYAMDPAAQCTVACHELLHVARRDWPWIVVEELARAVFWFHPVVWWLVERIQESREQLVDRLVIARIPSKRAYMSALLAFADRDGGRHVVLATAFLRKRHLRSRLLKLAKEPVMSRRRFVVTAAGLVCVMGGAIVATGMTLPLGAPLGAPIAKTVAQAAQVVDGKDPGVTLPKVTHEVNARYTPEALKARIQGWMKLTAVVRTDGTPGDIKVTESLDKEHGLDKQAVAALEQWRFEPGAKDGKPVPVRVTIEMRFRVK
jgi:TonB family protein